MIEIVITLVVLSIGAVGVLSVFTAGMKGSANPLLLSQAAQLAQGEIDIMISQKKASGFGSIASSATCSISMLSGFSCSRSICFVPSGNVDDTSACGSATDYKRAAVSVASSLTGTFTIVTLLSNF